MPQELGERDRCPHCGVVADVEPASRLRYRCRVCGGPRVPLDDAAIERSGRERKALKLAQRVRFRHAAWLIAAAALGGLGLLSLLVTLGVLLAVTPGLVASLVGVLAAAAPLALAAYAAHQTRRLSREMQALITQAWRSVGEDVVTNTDEVDAEQLARALRIESEEAEQLLTDLSVHDVVHARVTDGGELVFRASDRPPRLRIQEPEAETTSPAETAEEEDGSEAQRTVTVEREK
jgi:hypothetical protein